MTMRYLLLPSLLAFTACGDKDPLDTADTNPDTEPTIETADTAPAPACALPAVSASYALPWAAATPYGGDDDIGRPGARTNSHPHPGGAAGASSATLRSPITRARLNIELLPETSEGGMGELAAQLRAVS